MKYRNSVAVAAKFVFFAVPGGFIVILCPFAVVDAIARRSILATILFLLLNVAAAAAMLFGVGRWRDWRLVPVILTMPAALILFSLLLNATGTELPAESLVVSVASGLVAISVYRMTKRQG